MKLAAAKRYVQKLTEAGYKASLYEGYSGRCMYGDTTVGVVADSGAEEACPGLKKVRRDSMGLQAIYY